MKTINLSLGKLVAVALLFTVVFTSCKKGPIEPPEKSCDHNARFERMPGYDGYYGNYIIRLENGDVVVPCIVQDHTIAKEDVHSGMAITVSYKEITSEEIACKVPYIITDHHREPGIMPGGCVIGMNNRLIKAKITCTAEREEEYKGFCGTE